MVGAMRAVVVSSCAFALAGCRLHFDVTDRDGALGDDAPSDGLPASTCAQLSVRMCDGFEEPSLNARWAVTTSAGSTTTVDSTHVYRGASAFHAHTSPTAANTEGYAVLRTFDGTDGMITGTAYVRVWAYFTMPYPDAFDQIMNFATNSGQGISMGTLNGFARSNDYTYGQSRNSTTTMLPLDRWVCLELAIPSNSEGTTHVYIDDVEVADVPVTTPAGMPQPAPDHVYVGVDWYFPATALPATDAWFDEVIVDSQPIGCAK